ncbi:MAG: Fur family transcriptional regulator [Acidocella sp.]|nr:Fur family transcriptional regulator [Acidocella sp.]MDE8349921.1 Fur family transcriptional regulator [Acidocella sp.]
MSHKRGRSLTEALAQAERVCLSNGAQLTELRRTVLKLILAAPGPLTAYQLLDQLKEIRKSAVPPTVYRTLEFLMENRLVHKIEQLNAFISCNDAHHDHQDVQFLICEKCGTVAEIEDHAIVHALAKAAERQGFHPGKAVVELDGICAACSTVPH